jgi:hypothetical protein
MKSLICALTFGLLLGVFAISVAQQKAPIAQEVAKAYGLDSYGQIEAIRYTFNIQLTGLNLSRSWEWHPKTDEVTYEGKDKDGKPVKVTYKRSELSSQSDMVKNEIDPGFINDNYWLIFPFHAVWDNSATITDDGMQKLPIAKTPAQRIAVKYPSDGGYTPGDTWTLYVGPDKRVKEFDYHRGGSKKPTEVIATWAGYKKAGPLLVSTEHRGTADGQPVHISLSNVAVQLAGSKAWLPAR